MINLRNNKNGVNSEVFARMIWVSTFLAMIFALPSIGLFLGIYYSTGNLVLGAIVGFGAHFVTLIFSSKISKFLTSIMS